MTSPAASGPAPQITVTDNPAAHRYDVTVDGEPAGRLDYRRDGDAIAFTHAEVASRFEGRGVGSALARAAIDVVITQGNTFAPLCPFVADYVVRHPAYLEHVDAAHRPAIEARIAAKSETAQ